MRLENLKPISWIIVGLGNPGDEYKNSRHNVGWMMVDSVADKQNTDGWRESDEGALLYNHSEFAGKSVEYIKPLTFMNKSGKSVSYANKKHPDSQIVVIHDDIDMPLGKIKIVIGKGSGGHKGIESIMNSLKSKKFARVKVGVLPTTPTGKLKKPKGEKKVLDFLMGEFTKREIETVRSVQKNVASALEKIVSDGPQMAMNKFN